MSDEQFSPGSFSEGGIDLLPTSVPRVHKNVKWHNGMNWVPIFCANCGAPGGMVPEATADHSLGGFAFYLCDINQNDCAGKWSPLAGTLMVPDEVFWARVKATQLDEFGRELTVEEIVEALQDPTNPLAKLANDRYSLPEYTRR